MEFSDLDNMIKNRIYEILDQRIAMGEGVLIGGDGTSEGAIKGWKTRRANMKKKSGSKTAKKRKVSAKAKKGTKAKKGAKAKKGSNTGNAWINFVKKYKKANRIDSYAEALSEAGPAYRKMMGSKSAKPKRKLTDWQRCVKIKKMQPKKAKNFYCAKEGLCYKTTAARNKYCK